MLLPHRYLMSPSVPGADALLVLCTLARRGAAQTVPFLPPGPHVHCLPPRARPYPGSTISCIAGPGPRPGWCRWPYLGDTEGRMTLNPTCTMRHLSIATCLDPHIPLHDRLVRNGPYSGALRSSVWLNTDGDELLLGAESRCRRSARRLRHRLQRSASPVLGFLDCRSRKPRISEPARPNSELENEMPMPPSGAARPSFSVSNRAPELPPTLSPSITLPTEPTVSIRPQKVPPGRGRPASRSCSGRCPGPRPGGSRSNPAGAAWWSG